MGAYNDPQNDWLRAIVGYVFIAALLIACVGSRGC